jgi:hypothetical protein
LVGSLDADKLAAAVIRAIETDAPDVMVMPGAPRLLLVLNALAPRAFERIVESLKIFSLFRAAAEQRQVNDAGAAAATSARAAGRQV